VNKPVFRILLLPLIVIVIYVCSFHVQIAYSHDFSTTDESTLVTLVEQIKAETQLVIDSYLSNENYSAQEHAINAAELMKVLEANMTQTDPPSFDITQIYDQGQKNSTTLALVVANTVDDVLRKYGSAFDVGFDMTNMSNMMNMDMMMTMPKMDNNSSHSMDMMTTAKVIDNASSSMLMGNSNTSMNMDSDLVNMGDYEIAKVLSSNINELFSTQLRPRSLVNETANLNTLENSLQRLEQAVNVKALPEVMMDIVHVQIHPMLQRVYDLQLQGNVMSMSSMDM
jgi:hypothetical protein